MARFINRQRYRRYRRRVLRQNRRLRQRYIPGKFALTFLVLILIAVATIVGIYLLLRELTLGASVAPANDAALRLEAAKVALTAAGGLGALTALLVAYRKQRVDEIGHIREQDRLFTDRFTAAASQLGHEKAAVRLAGAYALTRIADDSERDRTTCLETLSAYLRMTPPNGGNIEVDDPSERNVRRTMLNCITARLDIGRPEIFWDEGYLNLTATRLPYLNLVLSHISAFANFNRSVFEDDVLLIDVAAGAPLQFKNCTFEGKVETAFQYELTSLDFSGSRFNRGLSAFAGWRCAQFIDLRDAVICGKVLIEHQDSDGIDVFLQGADLASIETDGQGRPQIDIRVSRVVYDERTVWPTGFQPPNRWRKADLDHFFSVSIPGWRRTTD